MRVAYFDCFSGASGDMLLGSLVDAGLSLAELRQALASLPLQGWEVVAAPEERQGVRGTKVDVCYDEAHQPHRHLPDILGLVEASALPAPVVERATAVFWRLARAEAHGTLPVPAPATLAILAEAHVPTVPHPAQVELLTPTGAALLAELARFERPAMTVDGVGYGFGTRRTPALNAVRLWLGQVAGGRWAEDEVVLLECNLDDTTGEALGYVQGRLLEAGALDAWFTPIYMKKSRPAVLLSALCAPEEAEALADLILQETSTLGVRRRHMGRYCAGRSLETVATPWGPVRVKIKRLGGEALGAAPEYEDCARLARGAGVPWREVYAAAERAWRDVIRDA